MARKKKQTNEPPPENLDNTDDTFGLPEVEYQTLQRGEPENIVALTNRGLGGDGGNQVAEELGSTVTGRIPILPDATGEPGNALFEEDSAPARAFDEIAASLAATNRASLEVVKAVTAFPEAEFMWSLSAPWGGFGGMLAKDWRERDRSTEEMYGALYGAVSQVPGLRAVVHPDVGLVRLLPQVLLAGSGVSLAVHLPADAAADAHDRGRVHRLLALGPVHRVPRRPGHHAHPSGVLPSRS